MDNNDQDHDDFGQPGEFDDGMDLDQPRGKFGAGLAEAWRTKPIFKLVVLMTGAAVLVGGLIAFFSSEPAIEKSRVASVPDLKEPPGGKASPAFIEAQAQANAQRIREQEAIGGSAIPTPLPSGITVETHKEADPLVQFRAELEKQKEEQKKQIQAMQQQQTQTQQQVNQQEQQILTQMNSSMQTHMQHLVELWKPKGMTIIKGVPDETSKSGSAAMRQGVLPAATSGGGASAAPARSLLAQSQKALIPAGTVAYAQMLTEANSDIPGPILAQILSGPLTGARAIGSFKVVNDYMTLSFNHATLKGKDYSISTMALDPDTTLGGLATEVDHRYFSRVILPAAAAFISTMGTTLGKQPTTSTITQNGIVTEQGRQGLRDGLYAGLGSAGQSVSGFFAAEAARTKVLVRVAAGTPMGLFFLSSVKNDGTSLPSSIGDLSAGQQTAAQRLYASQAPSTPAMPSANTNVTAQNQNTVGGVMPMNTTQLVPGGNAGTAAAAPRQ